MKFTCEWFTYTASTRGSHTPLSSTALALDSTRDVGSTLTTLHAGGGAGGGSELVRPAREVTDDVPEDEDELLLPLLRLLLPLLPVDKV